MVKAVIFDCFGVLNIESWLTFKTEHFGHNPDLYAQATELVKQANTGKINDTEFITSIARLAGMSPEKALAAIRRSKPNEELFEYITELKHRKLKIGLLSNVSGDFLKQLFNEEHLAKFDAICLSYQAGAVKPSGRIYMLMSEKLGVEPEEAVFVDDQLINAEGARKIGMGAIVYKDVNQLKKDLKALL